jgi:hypothetical protein
MRHDRGLLAGGSPMMNKGFFVKSMAGVAVLDPGAGHFLEHLNGTSFDSVTAALQTLLGH